MSDPNLQPMFGVVSLFGSAVCAFLGYQRRRLLAAIESTPTTALGIIGASLLVFGR